jgi:formylglycine-generating enzyme required for sulfatase activity
VRNSIINCNKCAKEARDTARFCDNCGTRLWQTASQINKKVVIGTFVFLLVFIIIIIFVVNKARSSTLPNQSQEKNYLLAAVDKKIFTPLLKHLNWTVPDLGMKLVYVAPGTFKMGSKNGELDEKPVHKVTITKGYWIGKYEVTQSEYQLIMKSNPGYYKGANKPVECVSWNNAVKFCKKLNKRERKAGRLLAGYKYRLATEAEWEYAARGGNNSKGYKHSGSNDIDKVAWYGSNSEKQTHEVGTKSANELGIHDMSGNVWEWCLDMCNKSGVIEGLVTDTYENGIVDPFCNSSYRVFRGGGWYRGENLCRVTNRAGNSPDRKLYYLGFRVVLGPNLK